jgi:hypothetical protein
MVVCRKKKEMSNFCWCWFCTVEMLKTPGNAVLMNGVEMLAMPKRDIRRENQDQLSISMS